MDASVTAPEQDDSPKVASGAAWLRRMSRSLMGAASGSRLVGSAVVARLGDAPSNNAAGRMAAKPAKLDDITVFTYRQSKQQAPRRSMWETAARAAAWLRRTLMSRSGQVAPEPRDGESSAESNNEPDFEVPEHKFMINPMSPFITTWEKCLLVLVIYNAVIIPWELAFELPRCDAEAFATLGVGTCRSSFQDVMEVVVNIFFISDIAINFRTGYIDKKLVIHMWPRDVARNYLRSWFFFDLCGSLPLEMVTQLTISDQQSTRQFMFLKLFKVLRLLRLGRLLNKAKMSANAFRIFELTCGFFLVAHWAACVWYYVGRWQIEEIGTGNTFTGSYTWIEVPLSEDESATYFHADIRTKYTACLYWAFVTMYTVGYGDIVPVTNFERSYTTIIQLLGCMLTAIIFGNVALLIRKMDAAGTRLNEDLDTLNEFIRFHSIDAELAMRLRQTIEHKWHINQGIDVNETLRDLPDNVRHDIYMHMQARVIRENAVFGRCSEKFIRDVTARLVPQTHLPDEFITWEGEASREMFFIASGKVALMSSDCQRIYMINGEGDMLSDAELFRGVPRVASAQAITDTETLMLRRVDIDEILQDYTQFVDHFSTTASKRYDELLGIIQKRTLSGSTSSLGSLIPESNGRISITFPSKATPRTSNMPVGLRSSCGGLSPMAHGLNGAHQHAPVERNSGHEISACEEPNLARAYANDDTHVTDVSSTDEPAQEREARYQTNQTSAANQANASDSDNDAITLLRLMDAEQMNQVSSLLDILERTNARTKKLLLAINEQNTTH